MVLAICETAQCAAEGARKIQFQEIAKELRTSYEMACYSRNESKTGSVRKIIIKSKLDGVSARSKTE